MVPESGNDLMNRSKTGSGMTLSNRLGASLNGPEKQVIVIAPALKLSGRELLARTCSFWPDVVYL